ncbi:MAG: NADP-specific glutamate dehydrogenase [Aestuariibacter sp.]
MPDRIIQFNVSWLDDENHVQVNQGWRVQHNNLIGPYKGGLRFHPSVSQSVFKFLALEQSFKNTLTGLPIGGAKGGSDFNPKGRTDGEIMRFCQAFMTELHRYIGPTRDVPAGDINVGSREIGYLFGQYRRLTYQFEGALTGKDPEFGGSHVRTESTGYGVVYFLEQVLHQQNDEMKGKTVAISGAGNVALYAAEKAMQLGANVVTLSNSKGFLHVETGLEKEHLTWLRENKSQQDNCLSTFAEKQTGTWQKDNKPWQISCDIALPCATQNELDEQDAQQLTNNGCQYLIEGANMPCTAEAVRVLQTAQVCYVPGKASNAGGVALSTLEMSQNAGFVKHSFEALDEELQTIMQRIHRNCLIFGKQDDGHIDYLKGANQFAFKQLADALVSQGI